MGEMWLFGGENNKRQVRKYNDFNDLVLIVFDLLRSVKSKVVSWYDKVIWLLIFFVWVWTFLKLTFDFLNENRIKMSDLNATSDALRAKLAALKAKNEEIKMRVAKHSWGNEQTA